jgi:hypothetical protein
LAKDKPSSKSKTWDTIVINLVANFGVSGAIIVVILIILLVYGTTQQYREFIDKFILLKFQKNDYFILGYLAIILTFILVSDFLHFKRKIALKDERIKNLEQDVERLQKALLKRAK